MPLSCGIKLLRWAAAFGEELLAIRIRAPRRAQGASESLTRARRVIMQIMANV